MSELSKKARNRTKVQMILTMLVIVSIIRQFFLGNYHNMFLGILTLILFMVPQFIDKKLGVTIPVGLETVILIFIFSAEILGEINAFYVKIPVWDTILHTTNGFLMAAIGFALIDLFNRSDRFSIKMSPYFVAFFAFCFSMTVGVLWEFFEFSMDSNSSKPQHTHTWVAQTKNVYHEATGHYENQWVQDSAAWDEDQYTEKVVCGCGAVFDNDNQWEHHSLNTDCIYGYSVLPVKTGTIHHEATGHNEQKWVQDSAAWTETVTTGYKCSGCGATK